MVVRMIPCNFRNSDGNLYVPYTNLHPKYRKLNANWVRNSFNDNNGFLVRQSLHSSAWRKFSFQE